jgi:hypothetical protein
MRRAAFVSFLLAAVGLLVALAGKPAEKDYLSYWSAGRQIVQHVDPYSIPQVLALERSQGYPSSRPLVMRNPPWSLFATIPLGFMSARSGMVFWTYLALGCVAGAIVLLEIRPGDRVLLFCFAPVLGSLAAGQSSPFLLLGVAMFLAWHRSHPQWAGIGLLLMAFKPHVFFLFWPLLLVDCLLERRLRLLLSFAAALGCASAFALSLDPQVWQHYFVLLRDAGIQQEFVPTPSSLLRLLTARRAFWVQWIPSGMALAWAIWFYQRHRDRWDWRAQAIPLLLVGLWTSPYAWVTDDIVLLPAVASVLSRKNRPKYSTGLWMMANGVLLFLFAAQVQPTTGAYLWTTTAWLACYLFSLRSAEGRCATSSLADAVPSPSEKTAPCQLDKGSTYWFRASWKRWRTVDTKPSAAGGVGTPPLSTFWKETSPP